jgi:hypothetical protein
VERVKAVNFGVGIVDSSTKCPECFVIGLTSTSAGAALGTIRECVITQPGTHTDLPAYGVAENTCLMVQGLSDTTIGNGGAIVGNRFLDIPWDHTTSGAFQPSCPHLITVANCRGTLIADNEAINCDGVGVYIVSWTDENVVIRNNRFLGTNVGVHLGVVASELTSCPGQHTGTRVENNLIVVGRNQAPTDGTFCGLFLSNDIITGTEIRLRNLCFCQNFVRAAKLDKGGGKYLYPKGIYLRLDNGSNLNYQAIEFSQNLLEVPDFDPDEVHANSIGTPYENAMVFWPAYRYRDTSAKIPRQLKIHGNRNLAGSELRLKAFIDWYEGSPPVYARTDNYWGIGSNRTARYKAPVFNGRAGLFYDEFLGALPRSSLGWVNPGDSSLVVAVPGEAGHPGIVKVRVTTTTPFAPTFYKYGSNTISLDGNLTHSIEFAVKRSDMLTANGRYDYECRMGLIGSGDVGVYFNVHNTALTDRLVPSTTSYNVFRAWAWSPASHVDFYFTSDEPVDPDPAYPARFFGWHRCRIDLVPNPTDGVTLEARFFYDGIPVGVAQNRIGGDNPIPTDSLFLGFRVQKVANDIADERFLLVDYFQHQIF